MEDQTQNPLADQPLKSDPYIGSPEVDMLSWPGVQIGDTCQIRAEEFILQMFTGTDVDEDALIQQATDNGWYVPGEGTGVEYSGNLLEVNGIPTETYEDASTYDLANELAQGHKVIVGVDADELWEKADKGEKPAHLTDNHAVVVSGIDTTDPESPRVIVSDPGTGEVAASYPMGQFVAAWQDSNFSITATEEPTPSSLPEMANFDYDAGHIPEVMGLPYEDFAALDPQSQEWYYLVAQASVSDGSEPIMEPTEPTGSGYDEQPLTEPDLGEVTEEDTGNGDC